MMTDLEYNSDDFILSSSSMWSRGNIEDNTHSINTSPWRQDMAAIHNSFPQEFQITCAWKSDLPKDGWHEQTFKCGQDGLQIYLDDRKLEPINPLRIWARENLTFWVAMWVMTIGIALGVG